MALKNDANAEYTLCLINPRSRVIGTVHWIVGPRVCMQDLLTWCDIFTPKYNIGNMAGHSFTLRWDFLAGVT